MAIPADRNLSNIDMCSREQLKVAWFGTCAHNHTLLLVIVGTALLCACSGPPSNPVIPSSANSSAPNHQAPPVENPDKTSQPPKLEPKQDALKESAQPDPSNSGSSGSRFKFDEVAAAWGLDVAYQNGEQTEQNAMIENLGGGVAILDFDRDGLHDLAITTGGSIGADQVIKGLPTALMRQRQNHFQSVGAIAGLHHSSIYTHGLCVLDFDNDGFEDLLITGYGAIQLMQNQGDGHFEASQDLALNTAGGWFTSAASGDFNQDGNLDLYVCRYVDWSFQNNPFCYTPDRSKRELCSPLDFKGQDDLLLLSNGDNSWSDATVASGIVRGGKGLGVLTCDLDSDGDLDIYVANDTTANFLYINNGTGLLEEAAEIRGAAVDERALPNGSMGLQVFDVDHDLDCDLWVTNFEREAFAVYRNEGETSFLHTSRRYGLGALGGNYVGFGTDCQDFDLDGTDEIVVTNGHVLKFPVATPRKQNPLLLVREKDRFVKHNPDSNYFRQAHEGRGLATADVDADGKLDMVITHINAPAALLLNRSQIAGHALRIKLIGTQSNRDAIATRLILTTSRRKILRNVVGGASYLSQSDRTVQFGLQADETVDSLEVHWPSGGREPINLNAKSPINNVLLIVESYDRVE